MQTPGVVSKVAGAVQNGPQKEWIEPAARAGYAAKGAVYIVLGVLAVMAAFGVSGGQTGGSTEAIHEVARQPFGVVLLVLLAIGLAGYSLWRFVQAGLDTENAGTDAKGITKRVGYVASGVAHVSLTIMAVQLVIGSGGGGSDKKTWLASALSESWGPFAVGALALAVIGVGLFQMYKSYSMEFKRELKTNEMSQTETRIATLAGRAGLAARGIVFPIMGYFLMVAAIDANAAAAKDVGGVLDKIAEAGAIPLAIIALGLASYGVLQMVMARYRRIQVHAG